VSSNVFELPAHPAEEARDLSPADWERLERNAAEIFEALGLDLDTPGTRDTPRRFVRALFDATAGYDGDPKLRTVFPAERPEGVEGRHAQIVEGPVGFYAL
jgi:GTP cyclohydrolase I